MLETFLQIQVQIWCTVDKYIPLHYHILHTEELLCGFVLTGILAKQLIS